MVFSIWHCGVLDPDHVAPLRTASFIKLVKVPPNLSILELMSSLFRLWPGRVEQWRSRSHAWWSDSRRSRSIGDRTHEAARVLLGQRSPDWLKMKNSACAAVKRAAEAFTYLVRVDSDAADQSRSG